MYITKYQPATNTHANMMRPTAMSARMNLRNRLLTSVIFQMRCAEPANENGADITTFSDANF
jgi:hypothetical protein